MGVDWKKWMANKVRAKPPPRKSSLGIVTVCLAIATSVAGNVWGGNELWTAGESGAVGAGIYT